MRHLAGALGIAFAASSWIGAASAQSTVYVPDVIELSGPGAVSGTNWRDGVALAVDEINNAGGILGRKIQTEHLDTQSNPGISRAQVQKVLDKEPYVVLGPIYSGSVKVNMALTQAAEIPQIVGAEAADITTQGNPWVFRTAFGQQFSMPKIANYLHDKLKVKTVAVLWVNNDFGKGGHDNFVKEMKARNIEVAADISTEQGQVDFGSDVIKLKGAKADAAFVYTNEEESARFLIEAKRQGLTTPLFARPRCSARRWSSSPAPPQMACAAMSACPPMRRCRRSRISRRSSARATSTGPTTTASRDTPRSISSNTSPKRSASSTARLLVPR